jgi:hypothetical protein
MVQSSNSVGLAGRQQQWIADAARHTLAFDVIWRAAGHLGPLPSQIAGCQCVGYLECMYGGPACLPRFHVRVLVPCYKEPLSVVAATLAAAQLALLPTYTRRTM